MKKIILTAVVFMGLTATAQVKIGNNPNTLRNANSNFEVEGTTTAEQFVVLKNGNVGIGTTTPTYPLHINSNVAGGTIFAIDLSTNNNPIIQTNSATGQGTLHFKIHSATSTMVITGNGSNSVGIGTTSPAQKLHVVGSIMMVDGNEGAGKIMVSDAAGKGAWTAAATAMPTLPTVNTTSTPALAGDAFVSPNGGGVILVSPDGLSKWKISVSNTGVLSTTLTP